LARVALIGLWHLGTVAAAGLARLGHTVHATDPDSDTVRRLQHHEPPLYEPGLAEALSLQAAAGRLLFDADARLVFSRAEYIFITFDTPVDENDQCDLSPIFTAFDTVALNASGPVTIVLMSQVPVGTCRTLDAQLRARAPHLDFHLVYHPENLRLGEALRTFLLPDFLVVGAELPTAADRLISLYNGVDTSVLRMTWESAEMAKHALNTFLATSISFANEIADLAEVAAADVRDVVRVLRADRRIGPRSFLSPGPGFSGGTLGRDLQALRNLARRRGLSTPQLDATLAVNQGRLARVVDQIAQACAGLRGRRVALLGLTYKPGTDTLRRSHALTLATLLRDQGAEVAAFDPRITSPRPETRDLFLAASAQQAVSDADATILCTPWPEFQQLDLAALRRDARRPLLFDCHNFLDDAAARRAGWDYWGVGIPRSAIRAERKGAGG